MSDTAPTGIDWASRVPRHKVRRLYDSDAQGMLDTDLLEEVGYGMYCRVRDMMEVRQAQNGRVPCRRCGTVIERPTWRKSFVLACGNCGWQVTWGDYYQSSAGQRLLPGRAFTDFAAFLERWPKAASPAEKMRLIDTLIHAFHVNQGIAGRPAGENVIQGDRRQVAQFIESLAAGPGSTAGLTEKEDWLAQLNDPIRLFRQSHSLAQVLAIARDLGIAGRSRMREDELVAEILRLAPLAGNDEASHDT